MRSTPAMSNEEKKVNKPMIENSDRGVTLNKSLAWTIGCGLIGAGLYVGTTIATLSTQMNDVSTRSELAAKERAQIESRVRGLENSQAQSGARFDAMFESLQEVKNEARETNRLLRQVLQGRLQD